VLRSGGVNCANGKPQHAVVFTVTANFKLDVFIM